MGKVLILGAGELGKQIGHFLTFYSEHQVIGFLDDYESSSTVIGKISQVEEYWSSADYLALGIGYNHLEFKESLFNQLKRKGFNFLTFIHPNSIVDITAKIGEGSIIFPGVIIDQRVEIGENTLLNNGVIISHDCKIGRHCFIAPGVVFSGKCELGEKCFVGSGSILKDNVSIVDNVAIGAGSLVLKSINKHGKYFGHPIKS